MTNRNKTPTKAQLIARIATLERALGDLYVMAIDSDDVGADVSPDDVVNVVYSALGSDRCTEIYDSLKNTD